MQKRVQEHLNPKAAKWISEGWVPSSQDEYEWAIGVSVMAQDDGERVILRTEVDAEVERLRVENAQMRDIVQAVADTGMYTPFYPPDGPDGIRCDWCKGIGRKIDSISHSPHCLTVRARALLGANQ